MFIAFGGLVSKLGEMKAVNINFIKFSKGVFPQVIFPAALGCSLEAARAQTMVVRTSETRVVGAITRSTFISWGFWDLAMSD